MDFLSDGIKQCQTFQLAVFHMSVYISKAVVLCDNADGRKYKEIEGGEKTKRRSRE